jgi:ATP-binding cassette subfamily C (CFTR/MRP) protein 1
VFSGLDSETEEQVFNRLLGKQGLFQQMKTTVLLVTHAVHRLPYSHHVIALDAMGRIAEQGPFEVLKRSGGYVQGLAAKLKGEDDSSSEDDDEDVQHIKYYFASIGWKLNLAYALLVTLYGTAGKLTEFVVTSCKPMHTYLELRRLPPLPSILQSCSVRRFSSAPLC